MRFTTCAVVFSTLCASTFASNIPSDIVWFDFSDWNHAAVTGGGQTLIDVFESVDVTATVEGDFTLPTKSKLAGKGLVSGARIVGAQTFDFTLSEPLKLFVRYTSTDDQEKFDVKATSVINHFHTDGGVPVVSDIPGGKRVMGVSRLMTPTGASLGYFELGTVDHLSITHNTLKPNKFEVFQIGAMRVVPEPGVAMMAFGAFFCLLGVARRARN